MFRILAGLLVMIGVWVAPCVWAQTYLVEGTVRDELQQPVPEVKVVLLYDDGLRLETQTWMDGRFQFQNLAPGPATCFLELSADSQPLTPSCGYYRFWVEQANHLDFWIDATTTGVVVIFGNPTGDGSRSIKASPDSQASVHLILSGLGSYGNKLPTKIVITGYWDVPTMDGSSIDTLDAKINEHLGFQGSDIETVQLTHSGVQYIIRGINNQALARDGSIASLQLQTKLFTGGIAFEQAAIFFCTESLLVYAGEELLDRKSNLGWQGIIEP